MTRKTRALHFHFFNGKQLGALLIKARIGSIFSHCGMEFDDGAYYDATFINGVKRRALADYGHVPHTTTTLWLTEEQYQLTRNHLESKVGLRYDFLGILGFIVYKKLQNKNAYFCSELGREAFEVATNVQVPTYNLVTPGQLRLMVETYNHATA